MGKEILYIKIFFSLTIAIITILIGGSLSWNINKEYKSAYEHAEMEAFGSYNKDLVFRRWASMHGGVYVPITDSLRPNPHLNFVDEQNITTTTGKKLTLVNPAYMTRLVFQMGEEQYDQKGHITSLNPIRPENKADEWETKALKLFEKGETKYSSVESIDGVDHVRFMRPMVVEKSCLKCHEHQGYNLGDIRGGISVSVSLDKYTPIVESKVDSMIVSHAILYLVIIFLSSIGYRRVLIEMKKRNDYQVKILKNEIILQEQNKDLIETKERAVESDRLKTVFLQNMSHEIRTPMNAIMGFSSLLVTEDDDKATMQEYSKIISQRCTDLLGIITDILDISRIETQKITLENENINLYDLFKELEPIFKEEQNQKEKQHLEIDIQFGSSEDYNLFADRGKLKQIFTNLFCNALKFTERGRITVGYEINGAGKLVFYVSDTGIGISKKEHENIFDRFNQIEQGKNRIYGGTGLGLSIVKGLVNVLGGEVYLSSELDKGSTFSFTISNESMVSSKPESKTISTNKEFDFSGKTLLIVEDDIPNALYLQEVFAYTNIQVLNAYDGYEAVQLATNHKIDVILMDIRLPELNGYEATEQIRKQNSEIVIIAQTAYASTEDKSQALNSGCNEYLSKPVKANKLLNMVNKYLDKTIIADKEK